MCWNTLHRKEKQRPGKDTGKIEVHIIRNFWGALAETLERIHEPCKVTIHGQNRFALNMLQNRLEEWASDNFISNGKPVLNKEEWEAVWKEVQKHEITAEIGKHAYSDWILREMEGQREKNR